MLARFSPVLFVALWSTGWVMAKYADLYADPLTFLILRYGLAALIFAGLCLVMKVPPLNTGKARAHAVVSGMFLHGFYLGAVWWAIGQGVPAAISGIIAGLQPLMTAIAAPAMTGERLSGLQRLGLLFGFCGIALAVLPKAMASGAMADAAIPAFPVAINIIGMASATFGTLYQKRFLQEGDLRQIALLQYIGALIVTIPAALALENLRVVWRLELFAALGWAVLGLSVGAIGLLLYLIRRGQVSRAASLIYLVPPLAAAEAWAMFGEPLTAPMIAGTVIAVAGVYLTNRKGREAVAASAS
ncbi:peptide ABC transporter ATP-binding protein [Xaviernesmea oryzae]|uniref:Peptide ABC transporter ATP-binding protein n=1 Tax=Xaviernesmea oryzae TaxID=464029 RepID=A0A1Q9AVP2_9HYPH|nr:DMT family transporter [Xaviernesmea oryzae]OLP59512.1 peptide ABC transporter ATP-binding protein [Xaviernesmea oryzae]